MAGSTPAQCSRDNGMTTLSAREREPHQAQLTALRYRCHVACPSTGITTANPRKNGAIAAASRLAQINPQSAIVSGFLAITRKEVRIASVANTRRSLRAAQQTMLIENTTIANISLAAHPATSNLCPSAVLITCSRNAGMLKTGPKPKNAL